MEALFGIDPEKVKLIKATAADGATMDELKLFLYQCSRTGLDPLAKQIYFQKRFDKARQRSVMTIITGIDGYRLVADRTGQYAGNDDPIFDDEEIPRKATVTVYKIIGNIRCPFTASARWDQYYPGDAQGFMWRKMPHLMLGKCAEALALRKAFPAELSGLYIKEEMEQADGEANAEAVKPEIAKARPAEAPKAEGPKAEPATPEAPKAAAPAARVEEPKAKPDAARKATEPKAPAAEANLYAGTEQQRIVLRQAFERHGLGNRDKHAVAAAMKGQPMETLESVIMSYQRRQAVANGATSA